MNQVAISLGTFPKPDPRYETACQAVLAAGNDAGVACAIFTGTVDSAIKRRREGYTLVVVANDIDVVSGGFSVAMSRFNETASTAAEPSRRAEFPRAHRRRTRAR